MPLDAGIPVNHQFRRHIHVRVLHPLNISPPHSSTEGTNMGATYSLGTV